MNNRKIKNICKKYNIENYTINDDGTIDVDGNVILHRENLTKLPLNFRKVSGNFSCGDNKLISLEGCPKSVGGNFYCSDNKLTTLEGCPKSVGGWFDFSDNKLTTLEGCPKSVGSNFYCDYIEEVKDYFIENKCYVGYILDLESYNKRRKRDELLEKLLK